MNDNGNQNPLRSAAFHIDRERFPDSALWLDDMSDFESRGFSEETRRVIYSLVGFLSSMEERIDNLERGVSSKNRSAEPSQDC